jgi:hypothetical protein
MMNQVSYVVQERWKDGPWADHGWTSNTIEEARETIAERLTNPIWHGDNNERKWRIVCRTITDKVIANE